MVDDDDEKNYPKIDDLFIFFVIYWGFKQCLNKQWHIIIILGK